MNPIVIGILAHVDAGKTTLSEALLYLAGSIRKLGRVDNKDAFLDTYALERARGITIFSKQARLLWEELPVTLLDTPGHVDFSAEMERTLQVLDCAILVVSGADGVQGHTLTLWRLLAKYKIPVFLFVNKMDQPGTDREECLKELRSCLDEGCLDFAEEGTEAFLEQAAMCDEHALEQYLNTGSVEQEQISRMIAERKLFPCYFGSGLKLQGVEELLHGIVRYAPQPVYTEDFGAKIYKISRDGQGNRLTYMKITGGSIRAKMTLPNGEKVNQIRLYSGQRFEAVNEAEPGCICAVTGLTRTFAGQGLGREAASMEPILEPVLTHKVNLPSGCDPAVMLPKLRELEEEEPQLHVAWDEHLREIQIQLMGEVQIEVLKSLIETRFGISVDFGVGNILYKETIADRVEGVGHFEPLRHYAEVHLILEPGERGSGLQFFSVCSEDMLDRSWQRLVLTHLEERIHKGVLTGAPITDMRISLAAGRAHNKHTEGGDFRQATYRALRQGLMEAESVLLEPWYEFHLEIPEASIGRAMMDIQKRSGSCFLQKAEGGMALLLGSAPVSAMEDYHREVTAYTKGCGKLTCTLKGYEPCHNSDEIIAAIQYNPEKDLDNPASSVFCAHGAGFAVSWNQVKEYMHVENVLGKKRESPPKAYVPSSPSSAGGDKEIWLGTDEIDAILERTYFSNSRNKARRKSGIPGKSGSQKDAGSPEIRFYQPGKQDKREQYLLVDGYNIIYAWNELKSLAEDNMEGAKMRLLDLLCNYQAVKRCSIIVVFDAYRVKGHVTEAIDYHNIHVVYTKEAETADQYIERFAHENARKYDVSVATSDGMEQIIIRGQGCRLVSAMDLREDLERVRSMLRETYLERPQLKRNSLLDVLPEEAANELEKLNAQLEKGAAS